MNTITQVYKTLIGKELRSLYRDRIISLSAIIIWVLLTVASVFAFIQFRQTQHSGKAANLLFEQQWDQQVRNPHHAAHFGTYLFKPLTKLEAFDPGLNDYTGTSYRIEAHVQHEMDYSAAQDSDASMRFGPFSLALVLQLIVPLLMMVMASSAVTKEKEAGTLKMLLIHGQNPAAIIWSKLWAWHLLFTGILLPFFILLVLVNGLSFRSLIIVVAYLLYYLLITIIAIGISALSHNSRSALLSVLICWLCATIILPKMAATQADKAYPVMPRAVFEDKVKQGFLKGLNGNDPYYERGDRYLKKLQRENKVVNVSGMTMQYNEDYQQLVFDHYYKQITGSFSQQQSFLDKAGFLDPFIGLRRISMSMSATDLYHHNAFYDQARTYRNNFIRTLNLELARHADDYKAGPAFFRQIKPFQYHFPPDVNMIHLLSLVIWVLFGFVCLYFISKRSHVYYI
jgi:ABC-2 type transport system permease protein